MAEATIDRLSIEITSSSDKAVKSIDRLVSSIKNLKSVSGQMTGLQQITAQLERLRKVTEGMKISANIGNQLNNLSKAVSQIKHTDGDKLAALAEGLKPLSELGRSNLTSFINQLGKLPAVIGELDKADMGKFASQMRDAAAAIRPLADEMNKVAAGFSAFPSKIQRIIQDSERLTASSTKTSAALGGIGKGLKFGAVYYGVRRAADVMADWVTESNNYVENLNLFTVAVGEGAEEALRYAEVVNEAVGIDPSEWIRNQGIFKQITAGFGVATEQADLMSKNLTQLGYDISSFYNIGVEEAMLKVQSAISGELEPVRRLGYAIDVATLQQVAYNHGIMQSVDTMTQAQKSQLRYVALMEQSGNAMGDLARTVQTPANAMRILQQQTTQLSRAFGNLLIPFLQEIIPWIQAFVEVLTDAVQRLAELVGFELPQIDYSGVGGLATSGGEAADALGDAAKAAKDLKNATIGIDELNVISPPQASAGAGIGAFGGDLGLELPEYDFLAGLDERTDNVKDRLKETLKLADDIALAFAAWKIASKFLSDLGALEKALGSLMVGVGLSLLIDSLKDIIFGEGLTWENILKGAAGGALAGGGLGLLLAKKLGLTWVDGMLSGAVVGMGVSLMLMGITDIIVHGLDGLNLATTAGGGALLGGILAKKFGLTFSGGALIGAVVALGLALEIGGIQDIITEGIDIQNAITTALGGIVLTIGGGMIGKAVGIVVLEAFSNSGLAKALWAIGGESGAVFIGAALGGIVAGIPMFISGVYDSMTEGISLLSASLTAFGSTLVGAGIGTIVGLMGGPFGAALGGLIGLATGLITDFGIWLYQNWDEIKAKLTDWWNGIVSFFTQALPSWWNETVAPWFTFEKWTELFYNIGYALGEAWAAVVEFWTKSLPAWWDANVAPWFTLERWAALVRSIYTAVSDAWRSVVRWWNENAVVWWEESVKPWFDLARWVELGVNLWEGIVQGVGDLWAKAKELGKNVVDGFISGVSDLVNGAIDLGQSFIDGFKAALDIHSPSKEMASIGEYAAAGLVQGFGVEALSEALREQLDIMRADVLAFAAEVTGIFSSIGFGGKMSLTVGDDRSTGKGDDEALEPVTDGVSDVRQSILGGFNGAGAGLERLADLLVGDTQQTAALFDTRQAWLEQFNGNLFSLKQSISENEIANLNAGFASFKAQTVSNTSRIQGALQDFNSSVNAAIANAASRIVASTDQIRINIYNTYSMGGMGFASGGFPEPSQLFYAREGGAPELVGQMGSRTAVANNDQIVEGIRAGVADANAQQNALLAEQNDLLRSILAKTGVTLDGRQLLNSVERAERRRGAAIMTGGAVR